MGVLRHTPAAVRKFGAASGVQLTGIGGIGKTAVAGRVISRLRADGWLIAVHEGRGNPTALIIATASAIGETVPRWADPSQLAALSEVRELLADPGSDDGLKLAAVAALLTVCRLLVVFDDFEQNLTSGGHGFLDPVIDDVITDLADAAQTGALLITSRYPLPGPDRFLADVLIPSLSAAELRRLFLRMPALQELDADDKRLLTRTIGGHPRLIEFTDALLRGGHSNLRHVQTKLRDLARAQGVDRHRGTSLTDAISQAMVLGSADILLTELLGLLTSRQATVLLQVAVCRASMTLDDLAFALSLGSVSADPGPSPATNRPADLAALRTDAERLADLTLLSPGEDIEMHPWTAELVTHNAESDLASQHEQALAMRFRRFEQQRGSYDDLIDIPCHFASLRRYDELADVAEQAVKVLPGTLATVAYLAEIRPLIPPTERAWMLVAQSEVQTLMRAGDLPSAARQQRAIHQQAESRAAADPAHTQRQRDLSISHEMLGDVAVAAGDLGDARTAYQASLDIRI